MIEAARDAKVTVYPIAIESPSFRPAPLQRLAEETGGRYQGASETGALQAIYASLSQELRRTWQVSYVTTARPGEKLALTSAGAKAVAVVPGKPSGWRRCVRARAAAQGRARLRGHVRRHLCPARRRLPAPGAARHRAEATDRAAPRGGRTQARPRPGAGALRDRVEDHDRDRGGLRAPAGVAQASTGCSSGPTCRCARSSCSTSAREARSPSRSSPPFSAPASSSRLGCWRSAPRSRSCSCPTRRSVA